MTWQAEKMRIGIAGWAALSCALACGDADGDTRPASGMDAAIEAGLADAGTDPNADAAPTPRPTLPDAGEAAYEVELGVPDALTGLEFVPLPEGGAIPIGGSGQAGLTARLALRLRDPMGGTPPDAALVELVLTNALSGVEAPSKPWGVPLELVCEGAVCDLALVLVEISHMAKLPELPGLPVWITLVVRDPDDPDGILAQTTGSGVLERQ